MTTLRLAYAGSTEQATEFDISPADPPLRARIHAVVLDAVWAIDAIAVDYADSAGALRRVKPPGMGKSKECVFEVPAGDSLIAVFVGYGSQAPGYPSNEIITLQFETRHGRKSPVYGGGSGAAVVKTEVLRAGHGMEIIGFYGARGGQQNLLVRFGAIIQHRCDCELGAELALRISGLQEHVIRQEERIAFLERRLAAAT